MTCTYGISTKKNFGIKVGCIVDYDDCRRQTVADDGKAK